jgi:hypothetical protein
MKELKPMGLFRLNNTEHMQLMLDVDAMIGKYQPSVLGIEKRYQPFKQALEEEQKLYRTMRGSKLTTKMQEADRLRDKTWRALNTVVKGYFSGPIEEEVQSAKALLFILSQYKNIKKETYLSENTALEIATGKLSGPPYRAQLEKLGLLSWVDELIKQNEHFEMLQRQRYTESAARPSGNIRGPRKQTDAAFLKVVSAFNATIELEIAKPVAANFATEVNALIKTYRTRLVARLNLLKKKKGKKV